MNKCDKCEYNHKGHPIAFMFQFLVWIGLFLGSAYSLGLRDIGLWIAVVTVSVMLGLMFTILIHLVVFKGFGGCRKKGLCKFIKLENDVSGKCIAIQEHKVIISTSTGNKGYYINAGEIILPLTGLTAGNDYYSGIDLLDMNLIGKIVCLSDTGLKTRGDKGSRHLWQIKEVKQWTNQTINRKRRR